VHKNLKDLIVEQNPTLVEDRIIIKRSSKKAKYIRFMNGCGIEDFDQFLAILDATQLERTPTDEYTRAPRFFGKGFNLKFKDHDIGVLFSKRGVGHIEQKKLSPMTLGLSGYRTRDAAEFKKKIIDGLNAVEHDADIRNCLISTLYNIEDDTPISDPTGFLATGSNVSMVTSDFGEVLAAYKSCLDGKEIYFPTASNNQIADYYENGRPISAKGRKGGAGVNLVKYRDLIVLDNDVSKFLYSLATHDRDMFFEYGAKICPQARLLADWVNGTTQEDIKRYVKTISYDDFYAKVAQEIGTLGIPSGDQPRVNWLEGDINPFNFTLNTVIDRYWGRHNSADITAVVGSLLNSATFLKVDIQGSTVIFNELKFEDVKQWQTKYWGNAVTAWNNWMSVSAAEDTE
jgi:hypothetical protein